MVESSYDTMETICQGVDIVRRRLVDAEAYGPDGEESFAQSIDILESIWRIANEFKKKISVKATGQDSYHVGSEVERVRDDRPSGIDSS